jgi:hypothetical protein
MNGIQRFFFGRHTKRLHRARQAAAVYRRRALFENLEDRSLLSVNLALNGLQTPVGSANVNVSQQALGSSLASTTHQSEIMLDVNPTNPLNIAGITHRIAGNSGGTEEVVDVFYSQDGGANWSVTTIDYAHDTAVTGALADALHPGIRYDPAISFDSIGNLYIGYSFTSTVAFNGNYKQANRIAKL